MEREWICGGVHHMTKPDRWTRIVAQACEPAKCLVEHCPALLGADAIALLRQQHAALLRKVKAMKGNRRYSFAYHQACDDMLAWLEKRGQ